MVHDFLDLVQLMCSTVVCGALVFCLLRAWISLQSASWLVIEFLHRYVILVMQSYRSQCCSSSCWFSMYCYGLCGKDSHYSEKDVLELSGRCWMLPFEWCCASWYESKGVISKSLRYLRMESLLWLCVQCPSSWNWSECLLQTQLR